MTGAIVTKPSASSQKPSREHGRIYRILQHVVPVAVVLVVWQLLTAQFRSPFFPPPLTIFEAAYKAWFTGPATSLFLTDTVFEDVLPSIGRLLAAWGIAAIVGVALGLAIGLNRIVRDYLEPVVELVRAIPAAATLPIFIILLGAGAAMRVSFIAFGGVIWIVLINTILGARQVEQTQLDTGKAFRIPPLQRLVGIILPAAMPKIFAGLRISLAGALILMVVSELILSTNGIGFQLIQAQRSFALVQMWTQILLLAILGFVFNWILSQAENHVLAWHRGARDRS